MSVWSPTVMPPLSRNVQFVLTKTFRPSRIVCPWSHRKGGMTVAEGSDAGMSPASAARYSVSSSGDAALNRARRSRQRRKLSMISGFEKS